MGRAATRVSVSNVRAIRAFNRFYTQRIGVLQRGLLHSPYSLTEVRVLYELANGRDLTATELQKLLDLDPGYLSRIIRGFERTGMLLRERSKKDGRQSFLRLTPLGRKVFSGLDARQSSDVGQLLQPLSASGQQSLIASMQTIQKVLTGNGSGGRVLLRTHKPGDMGWVMFRHGVLYDREYSWDERFEALVGEIVVNFVRNFDAVRERCWIAELDGERVARSFSSKTPPPLRSFGYYSSSRPHAGMEWESCSLGSASISRARPGIGNSRSGRTACWTQRDTFMRSLASGW